MYKPLTILGGVLCLAGASYFGYTITEAKGDQLIGATILTIVLGVGLIVSIYDYFNGDPYNV